MRHKGLIASLDKGNKWLISHHHEAGYFWAEVWCIYIYIPGTCLSSILGFEPSKRRPFPFKTRVIWVPGYYILVRLILIWWFQRFFIFTPILAKNDPILFDT